ncbi:MAG: hypothetical protein PVJ33_04325 [Lysobacterales bacterium]|jgi:cytochrome c oxidase assembly protein Cox11
MDFRPERTLYSAAPPVAGFYFARTVRYRCSGQVPQAQETREMPVCNSMQPERPEHIGQITFSNTFCRDRKSGPLTLAGGPVRHPRGVSAGIEE